MKYLLVLTPRSDVRGFRARVAALDTWLRTRHAARTRASNAKAAAAREARSAVTTRPAQEARP